MLNIVLCLVHVLTKCNLLPELEHFMLNIVYICTHKMQLELFYAEYYM